MINTTTEYQKIHRWLRGNFGYANKCDNPQCKKITNYFSWALLKNKKYEYKRENYLMLCKSCHTKYDFTKEGKIRGANKIRGRKHRAETIKLMSEIAKKLHRQPPPKTKKQIEALRKRMLGNTYGFKDGMMPWNKGKHPECMQGKNHPMWKGGLPKCIGCGKQRISRGAKRCVKCEYAKRKVK